MWKRSEIKAKGKAAFKAEYWACVLAAVILLAVTLGSYGGVSVSLPNVTGASVASEPLRLLKTDVAADTADADEIPPLNLDEILGELDDSSSPSDIVSILENLDIPSLAAVLVIALTAIAFAAVLATFIKILVMNPIKVACYQFFKDNALEPTSALKFDFNNKYVNVVLGMFVRSIFILLWSLLFIIPGIIKSYSYRMVPFILTDNPGITATDAITLSRKMMKGNKWKAFVLDLSFLGWEILSALTLGILGIFYVNPYVYATEAELYHAIKTTEAE